MNKEIAELVGAIIGDGNLWTDGRHYRVELTGDPKLDVIYYQYLAKIIVKEFNENPRFKVRQRGLRLRVCSKIFFKFLAVKLGIPVGSGKAKSVKIPREIVSSSWSTTSKCIRGISDSDGSFFLCNKGYRNDYPTIEITTTSKHLAQQLEKILTGKDFRVGFSSWNPLGEWNIRYVISINGDEMLKKWVREIGFSNPRHYRKLNNTRLNKSKTERG